MPEGESFSKGRGGPVSSGREEVASGEEGGLAISQQLSRGMEGVEELIDQQPV